MQTLISLRLDDHFLLSIYDMIITDDHFLLSILGKFSFLLIDLVFWYFYYDFGSSLQLLLGSAFWVSQHNLLKKKVFLRICDRFFFVFSHLCEFENCLINLWWATTNRLWFQDHSTQRLNCILEITIFQQHKIMNTLYR
jgi:hypothetical protein